jgi:hypothetical protein
MEGIQNNAKCDVIWLTLSLSQYTSQCVQSVAYLCIHTRVGQLFLNGATLDLSNWLQNQKASTWQPRRLRIVREVSLSTHLNTLAGNINRSTIKINSEIRFVIFEVQSHYRVGSTGLPILFLSRPTSFSTNTFVDLVVFFNNFLYFDYFEEGKQCRLSDGPIPRSEQSYWLYVSHWVWPSATAIINAFNE